MSFSADKSVYSIILLYLQPFELAVVRDTHTYETYIDATVCGSVEYLITYRHLSGKINDTRLLGYAAQNGQIDAMKLFFKWGATHLYDAFRGAAQAGQLEALRLLAKKATYMYMMNNSLCYAAQAGQLGSIALLVQLGAQSLDRALREAAEHNQHDALTLLAKLGATDFDGALRVTIQPDTIRLIVKLSAAPGTLRASPSR